MSYSEHFTLAQASVDLSLLLRSPAPVEGYYHLTEFSNGSSKERIIGQVKLKVAPNPACPLYLTTDISSENTRFVGSNVPFEEASPKEFRKLEVSETSGDLPPILKSAQSFDSRTNDNSYYEVRHINVLNRSHGFLHQSTQLIY